MSIEALGGMERPVVICQEKNAFGTGILEQFCVHLGSIWSGRRETKVVVPNGAQRGRLEKWAEPTKRVYCKRDQ